MKQVTFMIFGALLLTACAEEPKYTSTPSSSSSSYDSEPFYNFPTGNTPARGTSSDIPANTPVTVTPTDPTGGFGNVQVPPTSNNNNNNNSSSDQKLRTFLTQLYNTMFYRAPDEAGLQWWMNHYNSGKTNCREMVRSFLRHEEAMHITGPAEAGNREAQGHFLTLLYHGVLYRTADVEGYRYWLLEMYRGVSARAVEESFIYSNEFRARCASYGIRH